MICAHKPMRNTDDQNVLNDTSIPAIGGLGILGGGHLINKGVGDVAAVARARDAAYGAVDRLNMLATTAAPSRSTEAVNLYKDLASSAEQLARSSDELNSRFPYLSKWVSPEFGHDKLRQSLTRGLLSRLHPEGLRNAEAIVAPSDVIGKMRAAGFKDFDKGHWIKDNFNSLRAGAGSLAGHSLKPAEDLASILRHVGRGKIGIGALLAGGGTALLANRLMQKKADDETARDISAAASPLAAWLATKGVSQIVNPAKDVLVSWGEDDALGQGHASPGKNIAKMINEDPRFQAIGTKAVSAPATQGLLTTSNPEALKRRYALGVDSGWGVLDKKYSKEWGENKFRTGGSSFVDALVTRPGLLGGEVYSPGENFLSNIGRVVSFHPDAPSNVSGMSYKAITGNKEFEGLSGLLRRLFTNQGKFHNITYGDPSGYKGSNIGFAGPAHPAANISTSPALARDAYAKLVASRLAEFNPGTTPEEWLSQIGDKKILAVSGASRGDSVGARVAEIQKAIQEAGDDHFVLGLGGKTMEAQKAIAEAAGLGKAGVGFVGFNPDFVPLAQNADIHFMGMGGATPYEMLASSGRAPIVRTMDEQVQERVFRGSDHSPESIKDWLDRHGEDSPGRFHEGDFNPRAGLEGKQRELARKALDSGTITDPKIKESLEDIFRADSRNWMIPTRVVNEAGEVIAEPGSHKALKRGLDGILDYIESKGVRGVKFGEGRDIHNLLDELRSGKLAGISDAARSAVRADIGASKAGLADQLLSHLQASRNLERLGGAGKLGLGAMALAPLASALMKDREKSAYYDIEQNKKDILPAVGVGLGGLKLLNSGGAMEAAERMQNISEKGFSLGGNAAKGLPDLMNEYANVGQELMRSDPLGIPNKLIAKLSPPSLVAVGSHGTEARKMFNPKAYVSHLVHELVSPKLGNKLAEKLGVAEGRRMLGEHTGHYTGFIDNPHRQLQLELNNEVWKHLKDKPLTEAVLSAPTIGESMKLLHSRGAGWIAEDFGRKFVSAANQYGRLGKGLGRTGMAAGILGLGLGGATLFHNHQGQ